jgi:2-oxoglutarate dehydrogenase E2 component (dihydrolipoamide succinyltransferase)
MAVEIKVPALGESVTEATVAKWLVKAGDTVTVDQPLCELETDKVTVEVNALSAGTVADLAVAEGATVPAAVPHRSRRRLRHLQRRPLRRPC